MCHNAINETINYYLNRGSKSIDTSKAFNRLNYDKLLIKQDFPPIVIRALLNMYTKHNAWTARNNHYSEYFVVQNEIRQGGIISPLLYTVYVDELLNRLEEEGNGWHIGSKYYEAICYADDMQILCPSVYGLQSMINICTECGIEYDITYNKDKSVCMVFLRRNYNQNNNNSIYLSGSKLECVQKVKHLVCGLHQTWITARS